MPTDAEREALAQRVEHEIRAVGGGWLAESLPAISDAAVRAVEYLGYHNGTRIPAEGTPEWEAAVERMARAIETQLGMPIAGALAALRALREAGNDR